MNFIIIIISSINEIHGKKIIINMNDPPIRII